MATEQVTVKPRTVFLFASKAQRTRWTYAVNHDAENAGGTQMSLWWCRGVLPLDELHREVEHELHEVELSCIKAGHSFTEVFDDIRAKTAEVFADAGGGRWQRRLVAAGAHQGASSRLGPRTRPGSRSRVGAGTAGGTGEGAWANASPLPPEP